MTAPAAAEKAEEKPQEAEAHVILFATPTCPNCKIAMAALEKANVAYEKIYATEQPELAKQYGVRQAPTLVVVHGAESAKYAGVSEIKKYLNA